MKKYLSIFFVAAAGLLGLGCAINPTSPNHLNATVARFGYGASYQTAVVPPRGFIFTHYHAPLMTNFNGQGPVTSKSGEASTQYVWVPISGALSFSWANAALQEAAREGGIKEINYADYEVFNVLGIYSKFTVRAYGQ